MFGEVVAEAKSDTDEAGLEIEEDKDKETDEEENPLQRFARRQNQQERRRRLAALFANGTMVLLGSL